jgi:uncharacterized membrane protein YgcG
MDALYGAAEVVLERVSDPQRALGDAGRSWVEREVVRFETGFPQAFVAVRVASLGSGPALRQFGFWLLNRAALTDGEITRPNENGVLVLIDPPARLASITLGYQLEPWLPEAALEHVLASARKDFQAGRLAAGAVRLVQELGSTLRRSLRAPAAGEGDSVLPAPLAGLPKLRGRTEGESAHDTPSPHET